MSNLNVQQRKFVVKAGMTVDDVKNSKEATALQKKYASAFDTDGQKGFSQKEADLFNATTFSEKADGSVTFWTRQKDGTKKGTKFDSKDNNIQFKSENEVKPYVKKVAVQPLSVSIKETDEILSCVMKGYEKYGLTKENIQNDPKIKQLLKDYNDNIKLIESKYSCTKELDFAVGGFATVAVGGTGAAFALMELAGLAAASTAVAAVAIPAAITAGVWYYDDLKENKQKDEKRASLANNIKNRIKEMVAEHQKKLQKEKEVQAAKERDEKTLATIPLLGEEKGNSIGKILYANGFRDIDCIKAKNDLYEIFSKDNSGKNIDIKLGKVADNDYAGLMTKITKDGKSEIYLVKVEYLECAHSKKLKVSKVRVVQDGVEDNSKTERKEDKARVITTEHEVASNSGNTYSFGSETSQAKGKLIFIGAKSQSNKRTDMMTNMTSKDVRDFNRIISEVRPEGREITIYSLSV